MGYYTKAQLEAQLAEVQTAISNTLTAQSYGTAAGNSKRNAELEALQKREKYLLEQIAVLDGESSGRTNYASFNER